MAATRLTGLPIVIRVAFNIRADTISRRMIYGALLIAGLFVFTPDANAQAVPVELQKTEQGWQLLRDGEPYFIRGAGGDASLAALKAAGGNSIRTWGGDGTLEILNQAQALGLTVTVGIWLGHERLRGWLWGPMLLPGVIKWKRLKHGLACSSPMARALARSMR